MDNKLKKYQAKMDHSYTLGAFPTIELLKNRPQYVQKVMFHPDMNSEEQKEIITKLCEENHILLEVNKKDTEKIRDKDNCYCIGVFSKFQDELDGTKNHVILVNPSDMGNLGTIIRTCIGFGIKDIAIVEPAADYFNPKVVRASMGALFQMRISKFSSFDEYRANYESLKDESTLSKRAFYPFMLKGATTLQSLEIRKGQSYGLIFGNESSGLPDDFARVGQSVFIKHENTIDSLNLSMAVGIALYEFSK